MLRTCDRGRQLVDVPLEFRQIYLIVDLKSGKIWCRTAGQEVSWLAALQLHISNKCCASAEPPEYRPNRDAVQGGVVPVGLGLFKLGLRK